MRLIGRFCGSRLTHFPPCFKNNTWWPYPMEGGINRLRVSELRAGPVKELLERERELAAVEELLGRRGGALAIEVGVGLGKTSLVAAACRRAQELGYEVLSA